ncbi:uncharacterized protein HD556DRAFT_811344 [Suillus plorans]|uniref:Uncharacterized protein n=1 Tax=Suillus plorans TaxID=116603 RepID=A0A9P7J4P1_9AGAM|nr:uncharacterized protein HD556DRAFT_811344 [Suillus plorans]KAG1802289.1 hypothetical protein HD556DRAFT_811344 [Suillus plorans]
MVTLRDLPVELWRPILASLVRSPGVLSSDRQDPFSEVRDIVIFLNRDVKTHSALLLVCKVWHNVVIELIHEHLHLTSAEQVAIIANRFEESRRHSIKHPLGTCTRRIDFQLSNPSDQCLNALVRILRCTPNIEILVNSNYYMALNPTFHITPPQAQTRTEIINALLETCSSSLRRIEWTSNEYPSWSDLMHVLQTATGITSLTLANIYGNLTERPSHYLTLPNLKTLVLGDSPSFSHASLGNVPLNAFLTMLAKSPEQLPSLQRLEGFSPFSPDFLRTHGPKRIGIFPISEDPVGVPQAIFSAYIMKPLEDLLCQIDESQLPKLTQVRIRNIGTLANITEHPLFLQRWWKRWDSRGVRFDDKDGRPFNLVSSESDSVHDNVRRP